MTRREEMYAAFIEYHQQHPMVWRYFKQFTFEFIRRGFAHGGAKMIMERVRWETDEADVDGKSTWKIGNNHTAFYSREFARAFPDHAGFFRFRKQMSEYQPPRGKEFGPDDYPYVSPS